MERGRACWDIERNGGGEVGDEENRYYALVASKMMCCWEKFMCGVCGEGVEVMGRVGGR